MPDCPAAVTALDSPTYRHELDGLRAIAVLSVLGYHAGYNDFAGGFMGVDVFLTLSGYLITQQITGALREGRFQPGRFWLRRVRRLLPAMLPVLAFALLSALLLKGRGAFEDFAGHFLSAGFFFSNYQFLSETDYFARASDTNLLLHTWSLSLEWQFYLVTPLVLMASVRLGKWAPLVALVTLAAASLVLAELLIGAGRGSWAFYGVMPRYWEFAAGGIVALLLPRLPQGLVAATGLRAVGIVLILWGIFGYSGGSFPGLGALLPVSGTALVLAAPRDPRDVLRRVLDIRPLQWVGLRSYAIYLVHWPLFVTVTPADMGNSEGPLTAALLVSLLFGHLIYRYVETPVRSGTRFKSNPAILRYGGGALVIVAVIGLALPTAPVAALSRTLPLAILRATLTEIDASRDTYLERMNTLAANTREGLRYCSYDALTGAEQMFDCLTDASVSEDAVLLIGDSHGRDVLLSLSYALPDLPLVMFHQSSCVPATYVRGRSLCFPDLTRTLTDLAEAGRLNRVILASRWMAGEHTGAADTLATLDRLGADVLVVGPGPTFAAPMESYATELALTGRSLRDLPGLGPDRFAFDLRGVNADMQGYAEATGARYFDRYATMCPDDLCRIFEGSDGPILYFDNQHLSPAGLDDLGTAFFGHPTIMAFANGS